MKSANHHSETFGGCLRTKAAFAERLAERAADVIGASDSITNIF